MRIIKAGRIPEPFRGTCEYCGTVVEFGACEARGLHGALIVDCPLCDKIIEGQPMPVRKSGVRYVSEVVDARATVRGCCDLYADRQACDCMENAIPD